MSDTRTPAEIERDIERERSELTGTIDTLQERFSLDGMAQQVTDHLKENGGEIARNISATVKQNPLGVALVGAGLAWLALGSGPSARKSDARKSDDYDVPPPQPRGTNHELDRPDPSTYRTTNPTAHEPAFSTVRDDDPDMDWYYDDLDDEDRGVLDSMRDGASTAAGAVGSAASSAGQGVKGAAKSTAYGVSAAGSSVASGAKSAADAAKGAAGTVAGGVASAASAVGGAASSAAAGVRDGAASAAESARLTAIRTRARLAQGTEALSEEARERVIRARYAALKARDKAASYSQRAAAHSSEAYDRQPLAFGALAFAIGAAAAATLPGTRREDEALGPQSDRLMRRARRVYEDERRKAQGVVAAVKDEARQVAKDAKSEIDSRAPGDKTAVEAVVDKAEASAKRVAERAKSEAKEKDLGKSLQD
ncbi:DUF3618 domain-containing protein [Sulfitobacter aestuariivivens]|uniref:DUF3618 domain-containing protein n=1 Tax=Sulfitobacter aestuariivivens TaxID=2766981 RepID=A0A927HGX9_9RHOB|nr:DUF3618 domain-containing protein [Sulfitobacter aestuariivivens]MBD3665919.1 DUF3618 domain-containing protein [Sulfitobacter aestuariivivens]